MKEILAGVIVVMMIILLVIFAAMGVLVVVTSFRWATEPGFPGFGLVKALGLSLATFLGILSLSSMLGKL